MLSPNTDQLTQERMQDIGLSATGNPRLGTARQPLDIPQITGNANLPLRWGEWLRIAVTATAWLPFVPLVLTLFVAALVMRFPTSIPALRGAETPFFVAGIVVTALVLIRLFAVSGLALDDWSWLASFAHIADPTAEQPHTEIGMIGISFLAWSIGLRLARHGGDYEKRRAAFLGFFVLLIVAVILTLFVAGAGRAVLSSALAVMLPVYLFGRGAAPGDEHDRQSPPGHALAADDGGFGAVCHPLRHPRRTHLLYALLHAGARHSGRHCRRGCALCGHNPLLDHRAALALAGKP